MNRYLANVVVVLNDKKLTAIREFRLATGAGLAESKHFCETPHPQEPGCFGGTVILNATQVADLLALSQREYVTTEPKFWIWDVKKIEHNGLDLSGIVR